MAILGIKAAGVGLTLTAASIVVFAELSWVPGDIRQAEDRAHRIGQASSVLVHFLMVRHSIDDIIWETVQSKLDTTGQLLDGKADNLHVNTTRQQVQKGQTTLSSFMTQQPDELGDPGGAQPGPLTSGRQAGASAGATGNHSATGLAPAGKVKPLQSVADIFAISECKENAKAAQVTVVDSISASGSGAAGRKRQQPEGGFH